MSDKGTTDPTCFVFPNGEVATGAAAAEIARLRAVLTEIATGCDADGLHSDFPRDTAAEALGIIPCQWPAEKVPHHD